MTKRFVLRLTIMAVAVGAYIPTARTEERPPPGEQPPPNYNSDLPGQGLTLGYWKNHTDKWPSKYWFGGSFHTITTDTLVSDVFPADYVDGNGDATLLQALSFKGGPGIGGAQRILLKQAVASLLNASSVGTSTPLDINFPVEQWDLVAMVTLVLLNNDRTTMLELATHLDDLNNLEMGK